MKKSLRLAAAIATISGLTTLAGSGAAFATEPYKVAQACGYYVVLGCYNTYKKASWQANRIGAGVVDTNNYPNFRNGYYCAADGPHSKRRAKQLRRAWRDTVSDAYYKSAC